MMVSDEEKRWLVVGIAINKVAAPVLRDYIKQGMDTHYTNNTYCHGLTAPCTLKTLTYHHVNADPNLRRLKFQNINNNLQNHGNHKNFYNYNINSSVDLAKLFLPEYLAEFSAFDESLDISAILRLLGFNNPAPIFPPPNPLTSIQLSADDVRENVRNKWGHCNVTDWTEVLFKDCFSKLETLVRSLGLTGGIEKTTLDQLSDWKTKGCQLCMGHAVDQNLVSLVQQNVEELIKNFKKTEAEQTAIQETLAQLKTEQREMQSVMQVQLEEHDEQLEAMLEWKEQQLNENKEILGKLVSLEESRLQGVEDDLSEVKAHISQTDERVKQLEENVRDGKLKDGKPAISTMGSFKVKTCRSKLAEHYKRTAKVPTSVWSKTSPVDIHQIYTRLSWVKEEQTPAGSSQSELKHYTDVFTANKNGVVPKRILVQGQTGIGKSTFVKKLAVDWAELDGEKTESTKQTSQDDKDTSSEDKDTSSDEYEDTSSDECEDTSSDYDHGKQKAALKKFELVLVINLKEASKCPSLKDVVSRCRIFPEEERALVEGLLNYVTRNQEKVLLVFDGYDEYRCGTDSEIYEIFRGNKLRNCCVLITTRNSKADDLREFKDVHAEITGFSKKDRKAFMRKMLGGEVEAKELRRHLSKKHLTSLTRVPLLLLFFCMLWKKGKLKSFPETKTKLYLDIVQYVLNYNQGKHSPARFRKVEHFKEILAEIGKVALECLLKDDHVFEYDQLSTAILCEEGHVVGLLQVTEYAENLLPAGMVSFIHKSIQEFLAAWYITYKCVPEGNLGGIEQHARTLEDCKALENVFQFICGLSDDGAENVFQHFTRVRISDPTLDLSKTVPDVENETDMPLCDVTFKHNTANSLGDLVYSSFQEVSSKAKVLSSCLECTGGIVPVTEQAVVFLRTVNVKELTQVIYSGVYELSYQLNNFNGTHSTLCKLIEALDWADVLPGVTENSEVLAIKDKTFQFLRPRFWSSFSYILCFRTGQFQFYITVLKLHCDDHARLFTKTAADSFPSLLTNLCSGPSSLKFLTSLKCGKCLSRETLKALGTAIRNCKYLSRIKVEDCHDSTCDLLKQVPNPSKCSIEIGCGDNCHLTSAGAEKLASLLPTFIIITLDLDLTNCYSPVLDALFTSITHKTLGTLTLRGINLTATAAVALGRSLPQMTSLKSLTLTAAVESMSQAADLGALFGGVDKTLALNDLTLMDFSVKCSFPLTNSFRFFPNLRELYLYGFNVNEHNLCCLLDSLRFVPNLMKLGVSGEPVCYPHCCAADVGTVGGFTHKSLNVLVLVGISLNPEAAAVLGRTLPGLLTLQELTLSGVHQSILQADEIKALFGGFSKTLPLSKLTLSGFSVSGCLDPLTNSFRFFPNMRELNLGKFFGEFNMDEHNLCGLLESLRFMPNLKTLSVKGKPSSQEHCCSAEVSPMASITHKSLDKLNLDGISLTPKAVTLLARSLPKMSSLQELELTGVDGSILQAEEMEALFGGLDKTLPLCKLTFRGFKLQGCFSPLTKNFSFILNLRECRLGLSNMDEHACTLLESLRFIPDLRALSIDQAKYQGLARGVHSLTHEGRKRVNMRGVTLTPTVAAALGRFLPEMSSLHELELAGMRGSILPAEEIKALFGGLNKTLPLYKLRFTGYSLRGCLAPITESFRFFHNLWELNLAGFNMDEHDLCGLLESLNVMPNLNSLRVWGEPLSQEHCCTTEVNTTARITHKKLRKLNLNGISLTSAVAAALGQLLPEMPFLHELELTGAHGSILRAEEMKALFGGFNKTIPLTKLTFYSFSAKGCLAPLTNSFLFLPDLRELYLEELNMDEQNLCGLLRSLRFIPNLKTLYVKGKQLSQEHCCTAQVNKIASITHNALKNLYLYGISLTPTVALVLGRLLPEMSSLKELEINGSDGSTLQTEDMEALFGGFNKTLPFCRLSFSGFSVRGCLAPLTKSFCFFSNLRSLRLEQLDVDERDVCSLLENLRFVPKLRALSMRADHQGDTNYYTMKLQSVYNFPFEDYDELSLNGVSLTRAAVAALGRSLPEISSLQELEIIGVGGSILQAEDMRKMFGGFNKTLPLGKLSFSGFSVTGCLAPLTKSFCFFPNLRELCLEQLNMDEHDVCSLLDSLRFMPCLRALSIQADHQGDARCYTTELQSAGIFTFKGHKRLNLDGITMTSAAAAALGRSLPEMSSLQELEITGVDGSILQTKEMKAVFGGFNKTLPLTKVTFSGFSVTGCLAPLAKGLSFFPNLIYLDLRKLDLSECDLCSLLENFRFIPYLQQLNLSQNPLGHTLRSIVPHVINLQRLEDLSILETSHCEEDLTYVRDTIQQVLPELKITGSTANEVMR